MESNKVRVQFKYIIKEVTPWMMDEMIVFSERVNFDIIFLRSQREFFDEELKRLETKGVRIYTKPYKMGNIIKKLFVVLKFLLLNLFKFRPDYNGVIGLKSMIWFLKMDMSLFDSNSNIHAQFATQPAAVALLIKMYYDNSPKYSLTFHAYDIYFNSKWFHYLVKKCHKAYSISNFNIKYVNDKYGKSENLELARLGVFRENIEQRSTSEKTSSNHFTFGLMTWFDKKKGISYLLEAMLRLKEKGQNNIRLVLAGDGGLREEILEFIQVNGLESNVDYIGKVKREEKSDFFNSLDAFILPSISLKNDQDGIPVVLMEAIAYGLPIISTDVSGIPEICINDYNGHLVPERNVEALANSMEYFLENDEKMEEYGQHSNELSKEYDIRINSIKKMESMEWVK